MADLILVDDERDLLDALLLILSDEGYTVAAYPSGPAMLASLETREAAPDLFVADIVMPEMSGLEMFERVRAMTGYERVPFLFVSANSTPEIENRVNSFTAATFLRKPFQVETLLRLIADITRRPD